MYSMRYKAYRYRLYPNKEQQELINKHIKNAKKQLAVLTSKENYQC